MVNIVFLIVRILYMLYYRSFHSHVSKFIAHMVE